MNAPDLSVLEDAIGYRFSDKTLLMTALTHPSFYNENKNGLPHYQRLEFLGDAVLEKVVSEFLYRHVSEDEGVLSRMRSALVKTEALCKYAQSINLGKYLFLGKGEEKDGRSKPSTLENVFEALIAAIYLDGGNEAAETFILRYITEDSLRSIKQKDNKTRLQEIVQKGGEVLSYKKIGEQGPDHKKTFICAVYVNSNEFARGEGHSIKAAEEDAAGQALKLFGESL